MNQKELNELRRCWKQDKNTISRIYGCFVNSNKEIITDLDESLGMVTQEEAEKYLSLLKKALSGALGKNLIDIVFSTQQVMTGEEHRMLMELRASGAKDARMRQAFYQKVIQSLDMGESNYLLLLASDSYDVPHRNRAALRDELRGWYHIKRRFVENEVGQRFYFDFYGAKWLAFANGPGNI